jgi:predicted DNA-binding transcriptional regulator AlpA
MPNLMTMTEVAAVVRAPTDTLRYWRSIGSGPPSFKLGRRVVYREDDVNAWIAEQAAKAS